MSHGDIIPVFKYLKSVHVRKRLFVLLLQNKGKQISIQAEISFYVPKRIMGYLVRW